MRWLMLVLVVSLVALLVASAAAALHVRREHIRRKAQPPAEKAEDTETEEAP